MYPLLFIGHYYTFIFEFWQLPKLPFSPLVKFALLYCLSIKNAKVAISKILFLYLHLINLLKP